MKMSGCKWAVSGNRLKKWEHAWNIYNGSGRDPCRENLVDLCCLFPDGNVLLHH